MDLYGAEGMHPDQGNGYFLRACGQCLRRGGLLVSNHWSGAFADSRRAQAALAAAFPGGRCICTSPGATASLTPSPRPFPG